MDMTRATILEGNIDDDLWPELVLAMTYVENNRPTRALQNLSPYETYTHELPDLSHLQVLGSTVYVFLHEEERTLKSEKWAPRALKGTLVGYDGHTIYRVHLKDQKKVIQVKDLRIFEDYESKFSIELPDYSEGAPTFQGFLLADNDDEQLEDLYSTRVGQKAKDAEKANQSPPPRNRGQKVNDAEPIPSIVTIPTSRGRKVDDAESRAEDAMKITRTGRTIKLSAKAKDAREGPSNPQKTFPLEQNSEIENLIIQLTNLLGAWNEDDENIEVMTTQTGQETEPGHEDPLKILATRINSPNVADQDQFVCSTQFDVEEPETYVRAMQGRNGAKWAKAMEEELDQLRKNETWELVHKSDIEPSHRPLEGKWVYKVKRDVNGNITRFKARWVGKGYLQQFGVDFDQTFAAVVKPMAFRVLFVIAAFLYGLIDQLST